MLAQEAPELAQCLLLAAAGIVGSRQFRPSQAGPCGAATAARLESHLSALGVDRDIKTYPNAGHSILNAPTGWQGWLARLPSPLHVGYSQAEAEDAWQRMLAFFATKLS